MILIDCPVCGKRHPPGKCDGRTQTFKEQAKAEQHLIKIPPLPAKITATEQAAAIAEKEITLDTLKAAHREYMKQLMRKRRGGLKRKPKK